MEIGAINLEYLYIKNREEAYMRDRGGWSTQVQSPYSSFQFLESGKLNVAAFLNL